MELIEKVIKKEIKGLKRIKDTFDERFEYLRLDKNERLLPFKKELMDEFRKKINSEDISGYAEIGPIYRKLAGYLGVKKEQMLLASGSEIAIKSVYEACVERGDNIVLHVPCYAMYRVYAGMFGAEAITIPLKDDWAVDIKKMLYSVNNKTKFVVMENPNGFVGTGISIDAIEHAAAELKDKNIILLVDEAYHYVENKNSETLKLIQKYPNLILSQTFSKGHGLAGMRIGYLVGDERLMELICRVRPMHEITNLTALAVEWVLDHLEMLDEYQESIRESKLFLKEELSRLAVDYKDTHANFMILHFPDKGRTRNMTQRLREAGILIRRPFEEPYLKGWTRVCVGSIEDSKIFVSTLEKILRRGSEQKG